ncbi:PREDICTED: fatty acid synthase-like isoform X2 [Nicrophorus vespilloides]|uniref:Fatty acid synthase-like isoform X2 n=1 Tax=Nicrophorus vespilloides TaxID=110193 RepID=A0ABM1MYW5_NICVS|nr:PREDICTED: fatty acid synthase-like isoform X2 [Nicrophorus vespilloides]
MSSQPNQTEVVISGIGGFFPKAENFEMLKEALLSNESLLETRWKEGERGVTNKIGKCPSIEFFDTAFFGIHRQQATFMDPMQRLMLERTFEALVDAGVNPQDIRGKRIGCFMGSSIGENDNLFFESIISGFGVTGHSRAMMPNRISYWLNLKGPSCAYDSNWINGIEVLQIAFDAVREGHCEAAIIGTANLALNSELSWLYNDMGLLSSDGSTKAFDADASGYARSDGIIVMYIQRAEDAKRAYATIVGTATQFNGHREGTLMEVDRPSMVSFMQEFYSNCKIDPKDVDLVECYGCGIKSTDEAELNAIDEVYCKNRNKPLMVGSVKTNSGHSEASANLISIAKVLVAMETGKIPATLQYSKPNPNIPALVDGRIEVVTKNKDWNGVYAAVNGIGLSSSYAHCLLKSNPKIKRKTNNGLPNLIVASTRTEDGIQKILDTVKDQPEMDQEYIGLTQELFSKAIPGHLYRGYSVLDTEGEVKREFEYFPGNKRQTWFVFSGMGSQWNGMASDLMQLPLFAKSIMESHETLKPFGIDLLDIVTSKDPQMFDNILNSFVGIAAIQIALTDLLKALGITPDGIIGHSVGELGCGYADGCMTSKQMILCAYSRGKASQDVELIPGMMAAIGLGYQQIKSMCPPSIEVACHNSADSSTISGPREDMEKFVKELQDKGIFARLVNVANIAYHSKYIKPAAPYLLKYLKEIIPVPIARSSKWISTSNAEDKWDTEVAKTSSAEYHTNNLLSSVLFEEGSKHIPKDSILIEIAPHGLLQAILKRSVKPGCTNIPLTQRGSKNGIQFLLGAIGKMYLAGIDVNVAKIFPSIDYPVSKGTCGLAPLVHWEHGETWRTGLEDKLNYLVSVKDLHISLNSDEFRDCASHQLDERIILPLSSIIDILLRILSTSRSTEITEAIFENVRFRNVLVIPKVGNLPFYAMIQKGSGEFEVLSQDEIVATGKITIPQPTDKIMLHTYDIGNVEGGLQLSTSDIYNEFGHRGYKYSGNYKEIKKLSITDNGSLALMPGSKSWQIYLEGMLQQNLFKEGERNQNVVVPTTIQRINISIPNIPKEQADVEISTDFSTGISTMPGLQMSGLVTSPLSLTSKQTSYDSIDFVSLGKCVCENMENILSYSINLIMDNFIDPLCKNIDIIEVAGKNEPLLPNIKMFLEKNIQIQANLSSVTDPNITIVSQSDPVLIVSNNEIIADILKPIGHSVYVLARTGKLIDSNPNIITMIQFDIKGVKYSLLRKVETSKPVLIFVKADTLTDKDLNKDSLPWVNDLKNKLGNINVNDKLCLVSSVMPTEGITNFVHNIRSINEFVNLRFLFVLDKSAPNFSEEFYTRLFRNDNVLTVVKDGTIGTYLATCIDFKGSTESDLQVTSNVTIGSGNLVYLGINSNDETLHSTIAGLGNIDYSATTNNNKRIMGLARLDKDTYNLIPDDDLSWTIPDSWSMEDACTVPHAYAIAYYCLIQKARMEPGESVLIHAGCSAIGLAAISVASMRGCTVYTTVATDWQKAFLKKQFSCLKDRQILSSENTSFEPCLLAATGGSGVDVIINCQVGSLLNASIRCLGDYGRFVQLGKLDNKQDNTIGMSVFLRNTCLIGVIPENVFDGCADDKKELKALVQEGIDKYVVRPLHRKVVEHQAIGSILTSLQQSNHIGKVLIKLSKDISLNQLNANKPNQFICNNKGSHLVYGGTAEAWIDLVEWLVLRGARNVVVASDAKPQQLSIKHRLSLLKKHFKVEIIFTQNRPQTKDNAMELLTELYRLGPIQGVFILPNKTSVTRVSDIKSVQYIELALRTTAPKALFVNFWFSSAGICQIRSDSGFATFNIQWDSGLEFIDGLYALDDVLSFKANNIFVKNDKVSEIDQETPQALYKKLMLLLPLSSDELVKRSYYMSGEPELVQLPSAGPRRIRELPPVILVPGLSGHETVKEFARNLLYPTFCTQLPNTFMPIKTAATIFADKIHKLFPKGPYNIIGISWGGALALEISRILQKTANTQVTLMDAAPETIQAAIKYLGKDSSNEVNLLNRILSINDAEVLKSLGAVQNWNARVDAALKLYKGSEDDKKILKISLGLLKDNLNALIDYQPSNEPLKGDIYFVRPAASSKFDKCGLENHFVQEPQIFISNGDHLSLMKSEPTIDFINEKVTVI